MTTGEEIQGVALVRYPAEIIKAKMKVMRAITGVGKSGHNKFHNYDYASDFDVLSTVRPAMNEAGLFLEMWPEVVDQDADGNAMIRFAMQWQLEDGTVAPPIPWYGIANDRDRNGKNGDKWFNKAATAAEKYFLLKQFHIPAGKDFDPDASETVPKPEAAPQRPQRQALPYPLVDQYGEEAEHATAEAFAEAAGKCLASADSAETLKGITESNKAALSRLAKEKPDLAAKLRESFKQRQSALTAAVDLLDEHGGFIAAYTSMQEWFDDLAVHAKAAPEPAFVVKQNEAGIKAWREVNVEQADKLLAPILALVKQKAAAE